MVAHLCKVDYFAVLGLVEKLAEIRNFHHTVDGATEKNTKWAWLEFDQYCFLT
jgi:hypothetical protein